MRRSVVQRPELLHRLASLSSRNRATAAEPKRRRFERQGFSRQERQGVTEDFRFGNCFERHASVGALSFHPESFRADEVELFDRGGEAAAAHLAAASPPLAMVKNTRKTGEKHARTRSACVLDCDLQNL